MSDRQEDWQRELREAQAETVDEIKDLAELVARDREIMVQAALAFELVAECFVALMTGERIAASVAARAFRQLREQGSVDAAIRHRGILREHAGNGNVWAIEVLDLLQLGDDGWWSE